jgi:hypothetical protein
VIQDSSVVSKEKIMNNMTQTTYRIAAIHPQGVEESTAVPVEALSASLKDMDVSENDLWALISASGAEFVRWSVPEPTSGAASAGSHQVVITWCGQQYDLELEPVG